MKKISNRILAWALVLGLGVSLVASPALAADLTYSADVTVNLTSFSINFTIKSGSVATSTVVNPGTLVVTIPASSSFQITSASRDVITTGQSLEAVVSTSCNSSNLATVIVTTTTAAETVTFTPTSGLCTYSSSGGGGGGGGGGSSTPGPAPTTPAPETTTPAPTTAPSTTTGTVTASPTVGGQTSFTPTDAGTPSVSVTVPASAVAADTTVTVNTTTLEAASITAPVSSAGATATVGQPFSFAATSGAGSVTSFNQPVTVSFSYSESQLPAGANESDLVVMTFDSSSQAWQVLPTTVDPDTNKIIVALNHFSVYVLAVKPTVAAPAGAHHNGTLVIDGLTIYLVKDGKLIAFRDPEEYKSYGYNFSQAVAINDTDKSLAVASIAKAMQGALVLDARDNRTVYMIGQNGVKRGFTTPDVFLGLGYSFKNLPKVDVGDYPDGPVIDLVAPAHTEGALVLDKTDNRTVWWAINGTRQGFQSAEVFMTYGFSFDKVVPANDSDMALTVGPLVKFRDGTLVNDLGYTYLISDGKKLRFSDSNVFTGKGYKTSNAIAADLASYTEGSMIE